MYTYIHTYINSYIRTYIHTYIYIHILKEGKLEAAEEQVSPLRTRHEENMKKVFELSHTLNMKERQLQKLMKEKTGLVRKEVCHT